MKIKSEKLVKALLGTKSRMLPPCSSCSLADDLKSSQIRLSLPILHFISIRNPPSVFSMSIPTTSAFATVTLFRSLTLSLSPYHRYFHCPNHIVRTLFIPTYSVKGQLRRIPSFASSSFVEQLVHDRDSPLESEEHVFSSYSNEADGFHFENGFASADLKHLGTPALEVKELDELPEQWRRSKLAWLCKELPAQKPGTLIRLLNAQKKWLGQDEATYLTVHCLRIRENETAFRELKCHGRLQ